MLCLQAPLAPGIWPEVDWPTAPPESRGMSSAALDEAAAYARQHGGGSGCVIRGGYLVKEWGDPRRLADIKSATKGSLGATLLGIAVDAGLLKLEDPGRTHYPEIGAEPAENRNTGWLDEITVHHLATMTAGFDDGRPPKLVYRPGTSGAYSNDTSNMLAEILTLKFNEDLASVLRREVMNVIGVPSSEWTWRENAYRPKTVHGLPSREFASGLKITHRSLARIGYLYLRGGEWKGRQIVSRDFVRAATRPAELPVPWPYYGFYWGSNARKTYSRMPADTFWALGLGDSFVVVCPSLDIVAVRLGLGSSASQLPGGEDWGGRVAGFFKLVVDSVRRESRQSPVVRRVEWAPVESILRAAPGSDNWPLTWGDDDQLYGAYGDGWGFNPRVPGKLSLGIARISGAPPRFAGFNIRSATGEQLGDGAAGKKASGLLMTGGVLYMWVRNVANSQLAWSADRGRTWTWSDWKFSESFGAPTFLNFGRNYAGARDRYVYIYSHDSGSAYEPSDRMVLARVPQDRLRSREDYVFFTETDARGEPVWTPDIRKRGAVFANADRCYRSGITYNAPLRRYLWCQVLPGKDTRFRGGFAIYDAPEPWGPWTVVYSTDDWDVGPGETCSFPAKWMSEDGRTVHLVFSGDDSFSVRRATLVVE